MILELVLKVVAVEEIVQVNIEGLVCDKGQCLVKEAGVALGHGFGDVRGGARCCQ